MLGCFERRWQIIIIIIIIRSKVKYVFWQIQQIQGDTSVRLDLDKADHQRTPHLVLQGQDRVVLGGVDVQDVEAVLATEVVGDVGEGGAGRLGHPVVDDHHVVGRAQRWGPLTTTPNTTTTTLTLLHLRHLVPGDGPLWTAGRGTAMFHDS